MRVSPIFATNCRPLKSNKNLNFGKFENNQTRDFIKREYVDPEIKKENERNAGFKVKSFAQEVFDYLDATPFATIKKGHIIKKEDLTWKRPACGISPQYFEDVVGKIAKIDIAEDTIILGDMYAH